jgi:small redox-active disulfide protein 2
MKIKILGTGCSKCRIIEENLETALLELGLDTEVSSEGKLAEIVRYGVMITPALVIDEKVVYAGGKALSVEELKALISKQ